MLEVLRSGWLSLGPTGPRFESLLADAVGAPHCAAVSSGTAGLHLCMRLADVGPGDEVITSPYSFVASANCAIYEGATPVFADIDPHTLQPRPGRGRGGDHPEDEGDRRGRHLRLPGRVRRAARALRAPRARADRGLLRGARRALQGPAARLARPSRRLGVLPEQADDDRRGRRRDDRLGGAARAARLAAEPGPARDVELVAARAPRLQLPPRRHLGCARDRPAREARPHPRGAARASPTSTASCSRDVDVEPPLADDADHERSWFVYVVKLPAGVDRDGVMARLCERRHRDARRTCRRSTCSRTCASATASRRGCCR